jgi:hypothetical protein
MGAKDYAIVVGISRYPDLGNLDGPDADANDFRTWLLDAKGGNVPSANVSCLLSSEYPPPANARQAQPRSADLTDAFDALVDKVGDNNGEIGDRLYLYFAGHGFAPTAEDVALLMANAAKKMTGYHIPSRKYAMWFRQAAYFKEVVLFMDCCREAFQLAPAVPVPYPVVNGPKLAKGYFGFATEWSRAAREGPWGENGTTRGLFTLALLTALRGSAEADANGQISGETLEKLVYNFVGKKLADWDEQENAKRKAAGLEELPPEDRPEPKFDYDHMKPVLFNPPPGEAPCNAPPPAAPAPPDDGGAVLEMAAPAAILPASHYTVRLAIRNGGAGKTFTLSTNGQQAIGPTVQQPDQWEWQLDMAGLYKLTRSDGASKLFEVIGEKKEAIDVSLD